MHPGEHRYFAEGSPHRTHFSPMTLCPPHPEFVWQVGHVQRHLREVGSLTPCACGSPCADLRVQVRDADTGCTSSSAVSVEGESSPSCVPKTRHPKDGAFPLVHLSRFPSVFSWQWQGPTTLGATVFAGGCEMTGEGRAGLRGACAQPGPHLACARVSQRQLLRGPGDESSGQQRALRPAWSLPRVSTASEGHSSLSVTGRLHGRPGRVPGVSNKNRDSNFSSSVSLTTELCLTDIEHPDRSARVNSRA